MKPTIGLAVTGSFCTIAQSLKQAERLTEHYRVIPILSDTVRRYETRFFKEGEIARRLRQITGEEIIASLPDAEPIGPKKLLDLLLIAPCTGNTLSKLALGITDTPVTLAAKAHLRNRRPLVLACATNDALGASAKNIGLLLNTRHVYFVPFSQDDPQEKETSLVAHFACIPDAVSAAFDGRQLQPVFAPRA